MRRSFLRLLLGGGETAFEWVSLMDCVTRAPGVEQVNFLV